MGESNSKSNKNTNNAAANETDQDIDTEVTAPENSGDNDQSSHERTRDKKKNQRAKGRLYVIVRHPQIEGTKYTPQQMEGLLLELQKVEACVCMIANSFLNVRLLENLHQNVNN